MFFNDWLSKRRLYTPDRTAIVDDSDGRRYTYADLESRASRIARLLHESLAIRPGDRVACLSSNCLEVIDLYFACGKVGAVLVPLNFRLRRTGILELLEDCQPRLLVYESALTELADAATATSSAPEMLPIDASEGDPHCLASVAATARDVRCGGSYYQAQENDVAMILYTSGTTGRAKGAMIPWRQIHWNALNTTIGLQLTANDVAMLNMPLYHTGAWHVLFTPLMLLGGCVVLQNRFDAQRCNEVTGGEGVTILFGVPTTLRMMWEAANFAEADFSSVRFAIFGGESCPLPIIEAYQQRGVAMRQGYGLTEAGPNCFSLPAEDAVRKQGSIGFPNFHIDAKLVKDDGREADVGEVGELRMKGPHVFAGYWRNEEETAATLRDGWISTGDLMTRDEEGYFYVVGRKKEMYVSGGENVYPAQVERVLQNHAAVALSAVIGVAHPKWGETGWAYVKLHADHAPSESELLAWCKEHLASYQCPTRIVFTDDLPLGHSGKIDKRALRARHDAEDS